MVVYLLTILPKFYHLHTVFGNNQYQNSQINPFNENKDVQNMRN